MCSSSRIVTFTPFGVQEKLNGKLAGRLKSSSELSYRFPTLRALEAEESAPQFLYIDFIYDYS